MKYFVIAAVASLLLFSKASSPTPIIVLDTSLNIFKAKYAGCDDANSCYFDIAIPYFNSVSNEEYHYRKKTRGIILGYNAPHLLQSKGESCLLYINNVLSKNEDVYLQYNGKRGNIPVFNVWLLDGTPLEDLMTSYLERN